MEMTTASYNLVRLAKLTSVAVQVIAHNLTRWTGRIGLVEPPGNHQDPSATLLLPLRTHHPQGAPPHSDLPQGWPWQNQFSSALARLRALSLPS